MQLSDCRPVSLHCKHWLAATVAISASTQRPCVNPQTHNKQINSIWNSEYGSFYTFLTENQLNGFRVRCTSCLPHKRLALDGFISLDCHVELSPNITGPSVNGVYLQFLSPRFGPCQVAAEQMSCRDCIILWCSYDRVCQKWSCWNFA